MPNDIKITMASNEHTKKSKLSHFWAPVSKHITEFLSNSSIHGLKYLVGRERTIFEKSIWFAVLVLLVYTCGVLIKLTWQKWEENPFVIGFSATPVRLWEIPFPAVTVCPAYKFNKNSNFTFPLTRDVFKKIYSWKIGNVSMMCNNSPVYFTKFDIDNYLESDQWEQFLTETTLLPEQFFVSFGMKNWRNFSPITTRWGVCWTYNMLDKKDVVRNITHLPERFGQQHNLSHWSIDTNYFKTNKTVYPRRFKTTAEQLVIKLNATLDQVACSGSNNFWIILHHPADLPSISEAIEINPKNMYNIFVKPDVSITSNSLRTCSPHRRKCYFSDERYLYFFKFYTLENCKIECLANYTRRICGCVPYYLPHTKSTMLCYLSRNKRCMTKATEIMLDSESDIYGNNGSRCNCLTSCNAINYDVNVKVTNAQSRKLIYVTVKFQKKEFFALEKQELFGDVNFWATCGGLIGLAIGFSVVSLAEIFYYLCFRLTYNLGRHLWQAAYLNEFNIYT